MASPMPWFAFLLIVATTACGSAAPTPTLVAILHFDTSDRELVDGGRDALAESGVAFRLRAMSELPPDERPEWLAEEDTGWVLFVAREDSTRALEAWGAWLSSLDVTEAEPEPEPQPVTLGPAEEVAPERSRAIVAELWERRARDQEVRIEPDERAEMAAVDADNTAWLRQLVQEIGWIDARRFGRGASEAAFLLVQHSGDVPLMMAALPEVERDARAGRVGGEAYALLYDRLQFLRGGHQRYGTQVVVRSDGSQVVERLEDPDHVDERRKEIGLGPLAGYLAGFGGDVRIER